MAVDGFDGERWVKRLARAMEDLATIQRDYGEEIYGRNTEGLHAHDSRDPPDEYWRFYWRASKIESRIHARRYGPVRAALTEVRGILAGHPAWAELVEASDDGKIWFAFPNCAGRHSLTPVIAGLMARGRETGEDGFRVACSELALILEPECDSDRDPVREELLTGYHVVLFQGLMFGDEVPVGGNVTIVPFGRLDAFVDMDLLEHLEPGAAKRRAEDFTAAIVRPSMPKWLSGGLKMASTALSSECAAEMPPVWGTVSSRPQKLAPGICSS